MKQIYQIWNKLEEYIIIVSFIIMTLVTLVYVLANNIYVPILALANHFPAAEDFLTDVSFAIVAVAQSMTWSLAITKLSFAWMIFIGASYGVRNHSHIGIEALVKRFPLAIQKYIGYLAILICIAYSGILFFNSYKWTYTLMESHIYAEDLEKFGIELWMVSLIMPLATGLIFIRFIEIFYKALTGQIIGVGAVDEAEEAVHHAEQENLESMENK